MRRRDKSLWDMTVEIEASKLGKIISTLDVEHYGFNVNAATLRQYRRKIGHLKHKKNLKDFFSGKKRNPTFSMRNGFGSTSNR